jgi:hypothetical protein
LIRLGLRRNLLEFPQHKRLDLVIRHSFSGSRPS